jgi:hypothetical protein
MKTIILAGLAILVAASACGSAGAQAPPDTGSTFAYSSRQQVKCYTETIQAGEVSVYATCAGSDDLPLAGSCSNRGPSSSEAVLLFNEPSGWEASSGGIPGWGCTWTVGGQAVNMPNGRATMCCVVKSQ